MFDFNHNYFMEQALREAKKAYELNEVPVGAVVVFENRIIGKGYNQVEQLKDPTAHAEMIAISAAAAYLGEKRLVGCSLYVTLEPCPMCAGAVIHSRVENLIFGAFDTKWGCCSTLYNLPQDQRFNAQIPIISGIKEMESEQLLKSFFNNLRTKNANLN